MLAGVWPAVAIALICVFPAARAQGSAAFPANPSHPGKERPLPDRLPDEPSLPPELSIPAEPLGFSAPGAIYLGRGWSLASLDFLDENHLLFTFRVPGLIHREAEDTAGDEERQIRAVVLSLPEGTVQAEALWPVHDRGRYLWMLKDGHFLLRDRDGLMQGDAELELKPALHFPGPLVWLELDPSQQFLVTDSFEPANAAIKPGDAHSPSQHPSDQDPPPNPSGQKSPAGDPASPGTPSAATANVAVDGQGPRGQPDVVVRILRRDSGQVMMVTRARYSVHLRINSDGYLESLRASGGRWLLNLKYFSGGSRILGRVDSTCSPTFDFVSQQEVLVTACVSAGAYKLVAMTIDGHQLWDQLDGGNAVWPLVVMAPDGSRLARETLAVTHPVNAYNPLDREDIKGQLVRVFDAANGKVELAAPASPALDAGGNVAISPSGRRVAVLNAGAIQIFELPAPTPLAGAADNQAGH
jgi:hypothetical protein